MIKLKIIEEQERKEWEKIVRESPHGTIFHTLDWMDILEKTYKVKKLPIGIYENDDLIGIFPAFLQKKVFLKLMLSPLKLAGTAYGGPVVSKDSTPIIEDVVSRFEDLKDGSYIDITCSPNLKLANLDGYDFEKKYTFILDLDRGINEIWNNFESRCRRAIKKGEKKEIEIIRSRKKEDMDIFFGLFMDTYKRQKRRPPISKDLAFNVLDMLPDGQTEIHLMKYENRYIAGIVPLFFEDTLYYWLGGSLTEYRKIPTNILHWELIKWAVENGYKKYDMIGANIPGIIKFKKSFNPELVEYISLHKYKTNLVRVCHNLYKIWLDKVMKNV